MDTAASTHAASGVSMLRMFKNWALGSIIVGLFASNVATLTDEASHQAGYNLIHKILDSVSGRERAAKLLDYSPTVRRRSDIAIATKAVNAENLELKSLAKIRSEAVRKASIKVARRSATNASRNLLSIPGEAIPIIGTMFVLGVTAADLYDACQTIKDINELNTIFGHTDEGGDQAAVCGMKVPSRGEVLQHVRRNPRQAYEKAAKEVNDSGQYRVPATELNPG